VEPLESSEALTLFRVRAAGPNGTNPPTKALAKQIIPHLEGNPLAIELAAARAKEMGAQALLSGLSERFAVLSSQDGRPNRQATLRATIDWSWKLLNPWEQSTLAQLSIFRGGFTMEAAEEVLSLNHHSSAPWLIDILQSLLDCSLLRANQGDEQPRFLLYESIREYAGEKLDVDREDLEVRFLSHFAAYGNPRNQAILRAGGLPARRMLAELENLVHAFDLAILNEHTLALPAFMAVYNAFERLGPITRIQDLSERVLHLNLSPEEAAAVSLKTCFAFIVSGQLDQAKTRIEAALKTAKKWQHPLLHAEALFLQATVQLQEGEIKNAIQSATNAIKIAEQANATRIQALSQAVVGRAHRMAGQYEKAKLAYKTATELSRQMGDQSLLASNLGNEGTIAMMEGRLSDAAKRFGQSLAVAANTGDRRIQAVRIFQLGTALLEAGELESAIKDYRTARRMFKEFGERFNEAMVLVGISQVHYVQENYPQARALLFECLDILKAVGSEARAGIALANLGEIEIAMGEYDSAKTHLVEAIQVSEEFGMARISAAAHSALGLLFLRQGEPVQAGIELRIAEASLRGINEPIELGKLLCNKAELHLELGEAEPARALYIEAKGLSKAIKTTSESELGRRINALSPHFNS
jgi:predicted ATPase